MRTESSHPIRYTTMPQSQTARDLAAITLVACITLALVLGAGALGRAGLSPAALLVAGVMLVVAYANAGALILRRV